MAAKERWVGVEDVALHLDVNKDSIYRWIAKMGVPAHRDSEVHARRYSGASVSTSIASLRIFLQPVSLLPSLLELLICMLAEFSSRRPARNA